MSHLLHCVTGPVWTVFLLVVVVFVPLLPPSVAVAVVPGLLYGDDSHVDEAAGEDVDGGDEPGEHAALGVARALERPLDGEDHREVEEQEEGDGREEVARGEEVQAHAEDAGEDLQGGKRAVGNVSLFQANVRCFRYGDVQNSNIPSHTWAREILKGGGIFCRCMGGSFEHFLAGGC